MKRLKLFFACLLMAVLSIGQVWAANAAVDDVLWSENFAHFGTNTPSTAGTGTGTSTWESATVTYTQDDSGTKAYDAALAGGTSPELLLKQSNKTWTISGIPTGGATKMALSFLSNKTTFAVTTTTEHLTISGSGKSWTITVDEGEDTPETFNLTIKNTGSSNARIDNVSLVVVTAAGGEPASPVAVTGVSLNKSETTLEVGANETLTATVEPSGATNKNVSWSSDDEAVATVVGGVITAVAEGTATITVTTEDGSFTDDCEVTVTAAQPKITITQAEIASFAGSYAEYTWTANTISGKVYAYKNAGIQFNSSKAGYYIYNTDPIPGSIRKITMTATGTARTWTPYVSTSAMTEPVAEKALAAQSVSSTTTWNVTGDNTYFYLTLSGGATVISSIVIEYEIGGSSVSTPEITGTDNFFASTEITMTCGTEGAAIYYTTDATLGAGDPSTSTWTLYNSAEKPSIDATTTIYAAAKKDDDWSGKTNATFNKATVLTVAQALTAIDALADNGTIENQYVSGVISQIDGYNSTYHSITYWISADGTTTNQLEVYSGKGLNGADFSAVSDLNVGDDVTVSGTLKKYVKNSVTTPEFIQNNVIVARKPIARLAWSGTTEGAYAASLEGGNTFPTLTNSDGVSVSYSSSETSYASFSDASDYSTLTLNAVGSTVITATFAGNSSFKANSASYTLNVSSSVIKADISFECNGAVSCPDGILAASNLPSPLPTVTKAGKNFGGWFTDSEFNTPAVAGDAVTSTDPITLYAKWLEPYTVAEALAIIDALADNGTIEGQYVSGVISQVDSYNNTYHSITYWISADGTTTSQLEVYSGLIGNAATPLGKEAFDAADNLQVGDEVVVFGTLKKYVKNETTTPEFDKNNTIYSFNRPAVAVTGVTVESTASVAVGGTVTLHASVVPANATNKTIVWSVESGNDKASVADGVVTGIAAGTAVIRATSDEDATIFAECTVTVTEPAPLSPWATVYTSNVELKGNSGTKAYAEKVKITVEEVLTEFDALRACTGSAAGSCTIKVPAGTQTLHFHAAAWNAKTSTITVTMGETELLEQVLAADAGIKNSSPYTLEGIPYEYYYSIDLSSYSLTEETTITFSAGSDKRFVLFGVNAEYPAAITLDPASKDFGEVKENANAQFEFTITPNAMSTGDLVASIIGTNAAKFSVGAISENKVTVTFAPGEVGGPYSASLKIVSDNAEVTAALSGTGITSATPEIGIDKTEVAFGNVEQNSTPATQSVAVTLSNIDEEGVSAAITGSVFSLSTNKLTENGSIVITPVTTTPGTYSETLTLSATGATSKNVTVTMTVVDEWAYVYTSNVDIDSDTDAQVTIGETNYAAAKTSKGSSATITLPQGVTKIHMHLVAWKGEAQTVTVSGDCFDEDKEITIIANDGVSGSGTTYPLGASGVDYYCSLTPDKAVAANTEITISAAGSYRFVLFGVNQEGGILPVLKSIEIAGDLTKKSGYKVGDALNMDGLTVSAIYTLNDVDQEPVDVTSLVGWSYDPLVEGQTSVTITASLEDKEDDITINDLEAVASADPKIYVSTLNVDFGSVVKDAAAPADQTIAVTLTNVANATATLGGTNPEAFSIDPATLTASGDITISIADDVTATAGTYSATITIKDDADAAEQKVVNLAFEVTDESVRKTWNLTIASYVSEPAPTSELIQWTATYVSMKNERNGSGNTAVNNYIPTAQTSTRFYKNNELTITPNGKEITSVVFTATTTGYANALQGSEWTNATASVDDKTVTVTPIDGENAISAVVGNTCGFTSVQVNYKEITPEPPTPTADYTRTVTVGNYGTICLPNGGNISGAKLFDLEYYDGDASTLYLLEVEGNAMVAGRPYIFLPSVATIEVFYTDDANADAGSNNGLIGWLGNENKLIAPDAGNYILYQSQYWFVNSEAYVTPNHAYIHMAGVPTEPLTPAPGAAPRRRVAMAVNGENAATGFENIESGDAPMKVMIEGTMYILRGEKVYDATGRLVK